MTARRGRSTSPPASKTAPPPPAGDFAFISELNMLFMRMMGEIILTPEDGDLPISKLTHSQSRVLLYISLRGPQRMSDLARFLGISLPSTTPIVDALVKMKLMKRTRDPDDRRNVWIEQTAAGRRLHEQMTEHHAGKLRRTFAHLTPAQETEVISHLRRIVELMRNPGT